MRIRLTALVLLLIVGSSAVTGEPLPTHAGEESCPMGGAMGEMDCCKAALMSAQTVESASARLCCALYCAKDGASPSGSIRVSPQLQLSMVQYPSFASATLSSVLVRERINSLHGPPVDSHPVYIRNNSLLI